MNGKLESAIRVLFVGVLGFGASTTAAAQQGGYSYARVLDVQPIIRVVRVEQPQRECWTEEVTRHEVRSNAGGNMIVGGLIGGLIGSQIGSGNGRKAATATGALIGSAIGHDKATRTIHPVTSVERHCTSRTTLYEEERIDGYRVTYEYGGAAYVTRMRHHPGDHVRVQVTVRPAEF